MKQKRATEQSIVTKLSVYHTRAMLDVTASLESGFDVKNLGNETEN